MSYGSRAGVGALAPRWAGTDNDFANTTRPTPENVEEWLAQVSSILDIALNQAGFDTPIEDNSVTPALDAFINAEVAAMVEGVNGSGRFGPTAKKGAKARSRFDIITDDAADFVMKFAVGIERMGVDKSYDLTAGMGYRDTDKSGQETHPLFQRKAFGETYRDDDA
jgi:hypothetical protein